MNEQVFPDAREAARAIVHNWRVMVGGWDAPERDYEDAHYAALIETIAAALTAFAARQTDATPKSRKLQHVCTKCGYIAVTQDISEDK